MGFPIQKLAIANFALVAYYVLPNLTTFALTLLLIGLIMSPQILTNILPIEQKGQNIVNDAFNWYLDASYSKKIIVVIIAGVITQLAYLLPNWLIVLMIAQIWAGWDMLADYGVVELVETQVVSAQVSLKQLFNMIPRYQGE